MMQLFVSDLSNVAPNKDKQNIWNCLMYIGDELNWLDEQHQKKWTWILLKTDAVD